jgi:WD40 repeat protein
LWKLNQPGEPSAIGPLTGHTATIDRVAFSPDGSLLASASDDHTITLTSIDADRASRDICAASPGNLTEQQWQHYIPEIPFAAPC